MTGAKSRTKGSAGEREVAKLLEDELGMKFKRDLDQYRESDRGDLICDDDDVGWPFVSEVKRRKSGNTVSLAWEWQAIAAGQMAGMHPCVIYRFDRRPWVVRIYSPAIHEAFGSSECNLHNVHYDDALWFETDIPGFCFIAREIMARCAEKR